MCVLIEKCLSRRMCKIKVAPRAEDESQSVTDSIDIKTIKGRRGRSFVSLTAREMLLRESLAQNSSHLCAFSLAHPRQQRREAQMLFHFPAAPSRRRTRERERKFGTYWNNEVLNPLLPYLPRLPDSFDRKKFARAKTRWAIQKIILRS